MTVKQTILNVLSEANEPLTQQQITDRGFLVDSSVRRTVQSLTRSGAVVIEDYAGHGKGFPRFVLPVNVQKGSLAVSAAHYGRPNVREASV